MSRIRALTTVSCRLAFAVVALASPARSGEGYRVEGTVHDDFPGIAGRVAILPADAPPELDAAWIDRRLGGEADERPKVKLVRVREVRDAIAKLGVDSVAPAGRAALAAELGVDSFLEIRISELSTWRSAEDKPPEGGTLIGKERTDRARARVAVRILDAESGTAWFEGTTEGTMLAKGIQPIVADMLDKLFERAWPARRYR
jgi:hypothetical protein